LSAKVQGVNYTQSNFNLFIPLKKCSSAWRWLRNIEGNNLLQKTAQISIRIFTFPVLVISTLFSIGIASYGAITLKSKFTAINKDCWDDKLNLFIPSSDKKTEDIIAKILNNNKILKDSFSMLGCETMGEDSSRMIGSETMDESEYKTCRRITLYLRPSIFSFRKIVSDEFYNKPKIDFSNLYLFLLNDEIQSKLLRDEVRSKFNKIQIELFPENKCIKTTLS
jgi:hypothetical protein